MHLESAKPGARTVWPPSVHSVLAEFAPANGPASRASGGVIGLGGSRVSRQERPAPWRTQEGTSESRQEMPVQDFRPLLFQSRLCPVPIVCAIRLDLPPAAPLIRPPQPRWWENGTRQEPSWPPSPSNLSSVWRPQRVDGINIAPRATSWTSSFPLLSSRRRYLSPR
jgi:hypothetical protein